MGKKITESEGNKRYYTSITRDYIKGRRIKLTPNEKCLLGLIVYRSQAEGTTHLANRTICDVFEWDPQQLNRACKGLIAKGLLTKDISEAVHGQQGSEYTLLLSRNEAEQQLSEQQLQYQPILVQTVQEPPHVKPFHEQMPQNDNNDNEVISLLKQQNELLKRQLDNQATIIALLKEQNAFPKEQVQHLANTLICQNKSSVSASNSSDEQLPTKEEIVDSTPTPQVDSGHSDEVLPTPPQSEYLMAVVAAEEGGTIGGLEVAKLEPNERERTLQEARQRGRKVMSNCEKNGMSERDAAMKAREAIEEEYSSKLWGDPTFQSILDHLNYYATGLEQECPI